MLKITPRLIDTVAGWPSSTSRPEFSSEWAAGYAVRLIEKTMLPVKPIDAEVCNLHFGDGLSVKEIATRYNKRPDWVRTRISHVWRAIRGGMKRQGFEFAKLKKLLVYKELVFLTEPERRGLLIVKNCGNVGPAEFAKLMWPGQPGAKWPRVGGSFLHQLESRGWLHRREVRQSGKVWRLYSISNAGLYALEGGQ